MSTVNLGEITGLTLYPIKSLGGIDVDKAIITKFGLAHPDNIEVIDRKWICIDSKGDFLSQRRYPRMALIKPTYKTDFITLSAPGKKDISFPVEFPKKTISVRSCSEFFECYSYDGELSKWLSDFFKMDVNLVTFGDKLNERNERCNDFKRYMLLSEASLNELNSRLENKVTMKNFRPNLTIKNCEAFSEDIAYIILKSKKKQMFLVVDCTSLT